jgi:DNA mismatch repair ATPase MutS
LLGTNTRERQVASREVVRQLLESGSCGAVTTHDLSLTELAEQPGITGVRNVHFRDLLVNGKMSFDYRLRQGVVESSNALRVLELAGITIRDEAEAKR